MTTTAIGKELRKLRIDEDERLLDMAKRLDKSSAFVSAVETGKKSPPSGFEELIIRTYRLVGEAAGKIRTAADLSREAFTVHTGNDLEKEAVGLLARRMNSSTNSLSPEEITKILSVLRNGGGDE
jgi:hypothetical protein